MNHARLIHLIAHRGNAREFPENTVPAFESALALGVRFLELDVHISADGVPVVIHDHNLTRTAGRPGSVFDLRARELRHIDACEPDRFGERFRGTPIPLLTDVLALLEHRPEVTLFVEIKRASLTRFGYDQVVSRVLKALHDLRGQCVVISFDLAAIHRARQLGGVPIGWVLSDYDTHTRLKFEALQPEFLFVDHEKLPAAGVLWRGPWRWATYEVETLALAQSLAARGADYIETMAVKAMSEAMRRLHQPQREQRPLA
ncbi:MAG TPA: glycerophosphodiester phosphodiesterase family protein [Steroidobacteraceae bacterium]